MDPEKNKATVGGKSEFINSLSSAVKIIVIPTNEEVMIARETYKLIQVLGIYT
jgi:acetate kinase